MKQFFLYILTIVLLLKLQVQTTGCANIVPPLGGDKDTLPPLLLRADPADSSRNVGETRINLTFDEYITIDNFQQNVLVSPVPRVAPTATHKLNTVQIRLRDTLEPNTTYTINFGDAIRDINESNVMKDFTYMFSTGPTIDSLSFVGNVLLAQTGTIDSSLIVMLHRNPRDSAVVNERPRYIAKVDGRGAFYFPNLPAGTFNLYALKDEGRTLRYLNPKQLFAFADSPVVVGPNTTPRTLYAYAAAPPTPGTTTSAQTPNDKRLKFQTSISGENHDLLKPFSFTFEKPIRRFDSTKVRLATDSTFTTVTNYRWSFDTSRKKLSLRHTWKENTLYHLIMEKDFATDTLGYQLLRADTISFTTLQTADYGKLSIRFRNLDLSKNPVLQFVQSDVVVNAFPMTGQAFSQQLFLPGDYELRILYDMNRNGVWDPGDFFKTRRQPELVKPIDRRVNVKANWDNEMEIAL
ncbi:MAG: Ig-like domain-containing protein [Chitinophagaceae bacterium]|nr:Ig-like domain-containing protein [Chitinophagaceae bacterium]